MKIGKYGSINRLDAFWIAVCFAMVGIICAVSACSSDGEHAKNSVKKEKLLSTENYSVDTVTLLGHRYFLITAGFGHIELQHEETCKLDDIEAMQHETTKTPTGYEQKTMETDH